MRRLAAYRRCSLDLFPRLLLLEGDKGARGVLSDPANAVIEVPFPGGEIDLDTPADLDHLA